MKNYIDLEVVFAVTPHHARSSQSGPPRIIAFAARDPIAERAWTSPIWYLP
jgi:hypothetical protein